MNAAAGDDRILPVTRWVSAFIVPFLIAGFIILYLFPGETERFFAWTITPRMTPILMGAGYLAGSYFFVRAIFATRWHEVGNGLLAVTAFAWPMGLATLLHLDRFNHDHIAFWIWAALYAITPFLVPAIYLYNRRAAPRSIAPGEVLVPRGVRLAFGVIGAIELLVGVLLFVRPELGISVWPWQLTPLTARIIAGWFMLPGVGSLVIALEPRWSATRVTLEGALLWAVLILIGVVRVWSDFDKANPLTWIYVGSFVLTLVAVGVLWWSMEARRSHRALQAPVGGAP